MDVSLKQYIRTVIDFPVKGVHFRDITTLLLEPRAFKQAIDEMADYCQTIAFDSVVAIEARGFLFASVLAYRLEKPLALVRKPNKLPSDTITEEYHYEYSEGALEAHTDAMAKGSQALVVDDLLATGGTALATANLLARVGVDVASFLFLIDLPDLKGGRQLAARNLKYHALIEFEGG